MEDEEKFVAVIKVIGWIVAVAVVIGLPLFFHYSICFSGGMPWYPFC